MMKLDSKIKLYERINRERERDSKMRESVSFYFIALAYLSMFSLFSMLCVALLIKNKGVKKTQILHTEKTMNDGLSGLPF